MLEIPIANGVKFKVIDGLAQNIDNTLDRDNTANNRTINCFKTRILDPVFQVVSDVDESNNICLWAYKDKQTAPIAFTYDYAQSFSRGGLFYMVFTYQSYFDYEHYKLIRNDGNQGQISGGTVLMISEPVETHLLDSDDKMIQYYNHEPAFGMDYSNRLVPKIYLDCKFAYKQAQTEQSIYSNQGVRTKLKGTVNRVMQLVADVPDYLAEILSCIFEHDRVFINEVEYVADKSSEQQQRGESNLYRFSIDLIQKSVIGLNTHDVGFDLDSIVNNEVMNIERLAQTTDFTVSIAAGYILHMVTLVWKAGTAITVEAGTTLGGSDIFSGAEPDSTDVIVPIVLHNPYVSAGTAYFSITGTTPSVDVYLNFIKNIT